MGLQMRACTGLRTKRETGSDSFIWVFFIYVPSSLSVQCDGVLFGYGLYPNFHISVTDTSFNPPPPTVPLSPHVGDKKCLIPSLERIFLVINSCFGVVHFK